MKAFLRITVTLAAFLGVDHFAAQTSRSLEAQFKAAQHKEQVEGDLKGAIEQYKKIADAADRTITAKALIRMAECYQRLGDAEARRVYERILREYGDQKEEAELRAQILQRRRSLYRQKVIARYGRGPKTWLF